MFLIKVVNVGPRCGSTVLLRNSFRSGRLHLPTQTAERFHSQFQAYSLILQALPALALGVMWDGYAVLFWLWPAIFAAIQIAA